MMIDLSPWLHGEIIPYVVCGGHTKKALPVDYIYNLFVLFP